MVVASLFVVDEKGEPVCEYNPIVTVPLQALPAVGDTIALELPGIRGLLTFDVVRPVQFIVTRKASAVFVTLQCVEPDRLKEIVGDPHDFLSVVGRDRSVDAISKEEIESE